MEKGIWLFGAGKWGEKYIEEYGTSLCKGFVDNSSKRQGRRLKDVPVYDYSEFKTRFDKERDVIYITAATRGKNEIVIQLFKDKLHTFAKAYIPERGIINIEDSWNKVINSQLGEEIGLEHWFRCNGILKEGYKGFYLDIGAYHPFAINNTRWAHELGWRGMNIDPNAQSIELFNIFRPEDINLNCGVSDKNEELTYYIKKGEEGSNSFAKESEDADSVTDTKIMEVRNINDILDEHHIEKIDFVDIDVEGLDEKIVRTFNWKKYSPKCALIEFLEQESVEDVLKTPIHKKMKEEGYILSSFYTVTALYVKK